MKEIVNLSSEDSNTYESSVVERFTWCEDPQDTRGLLFVKYIQGDDYVYYDVPEDVYDSLARLSEQHMPPLMEGADKESEAKLPTTVGEYLNEFIVPVYDREGVYYDKIKNLIDERQD